MLCIGSPTFYRRAVPPALREHAEIVFTDVRFWVPTTPGFDAGAVTFDTYADDLDAVRRDAGLDRVVVMGHSVHAALAREYARRYPGAVLGVMDLSYTPGGEHVDIWEEDATPERKAAHVHNLATRHVADAPVTGTDIEDWFVANGALHWYDATFDCRPLWEGVAETINIEQFALLDPLLEGYETAGSEIPTLLCSGRYDYVFPYVAWDPYVVRYSRLTRRTYGRSGHYPMTEQPEDFVADVVAWLASIN